MSGEASSSGDLEGFSTLKLLRNFDYKIAYVIKER